MQFLEQMDLSVPLALTSETRPAEATARAAGHQGLAISPPVREHSTRPRM